MPGYILNPLFRSYTSSSMGRKIIWSNRSREDGSLAWLFTRLSTMPRSISQFNDPIFQPPTSAFYPPDFRERRIFRCQPLPGNRNELLIGRILHRFLEGSGVSRVSFLGHFRLARIARDSQSQKRLDSHLEWSEEWMTPGRRVGRTIRFSARL